jgi:NADPH-dependent 2,4-dienoyl-CoA reductase/sulfur reductase-like enzyme
MTELADTLDVLIAGAGISGMAAYTELVSHPGLRVAIVEHEASVGGELRWYPELSVPLMAGVDLDRVQKDVHLRTTVVGILPPLRETDLLEVNLSSRAGTQTVRTRCLLVCTGMLDKSRENNRIPGSRPAGVVTPAFAVRALEYGALPGYQPVIYAECLRDALLAKRLVQAGATPPALLVPADVSGAVLDLLNSLGPVFRCRQIAKVEGFARVEGVSFVTVDDDFLTMPCDAFVYASGRRGNTFALKGSGVEKDPETEAFVTDAEGRTSIPRVFAAGTCTRPDPDHAQSVEAGRSVARAILSTLLHKSLTS